MYKNIWNDRKSANMKIIIQWRILRIPDQSYRNEISSLTAHDRVIPDRDSPYFPILSISLLRV